MSEQQTRGVTRHAGSRPRLRLRLRRKMRTVARLMPEERLDHLLRQLPNVVPRWARRVVVIGAGTLSRSVKVEWIARSAAVTGVSDGREKLVVAASRGRYSFADVRNALTQMSAGTSSSPALTAMGPRAVASLAWLLHEQFQHPDDRENCVSLYDWVQTHHPGVRLHRRHCVARVEALIHLGHIERARSEIDALPDSPAVQLLRIEVLNPKRTGDSSQAQREWLAAIAELFTSEKLVPITLSPERHHQTPFSQLAAPPARPKASDHRVTVVISSFRPDERLLHAVRSVSASSWENLEILVVDDCSGDHYSEIYSAAETIDPRVTVHHLTHNGGTYRIRNYALDNASGEFITFHDSDDWMHPQRIELQVTALIDKPSLLANASRSVRVTPQMEFVHRRNLGVQICEPSLMLRLDQVRERIGYFDHVRKGADVEYRLRLEASVGHTTPIIGAAPMTFQVIDEDSLSNRDIVRHWFHPARRIYRSCFEQWQVSQYGENGVLSLPHDAVRRFYAPSSISGEDATTDVDIVVVSNWLEAGTWGRFDRRLTRLLVKLLQAGHSVAIADSRRGEPVGRMRLELAQPISELLNTTSLTWVGPGHSVHAQVVIATSPTDVERMWADITPGSTVINLHRFKTLRGTQAQIRTLLN